MLGALRGAAHTGSEAASSDGAAAAGTAGELPAHLADWDGSYATAYVDGASSEEDDEGYWRGAWSEDVRSGGLDSPGPAEPSPEAQWPTPAHWPRPAAADGEPCAAEVRVLPGRGRAAIATRQLRPGDEVGLERPFAFVVRATHAGSSCAHCAASVAKGGHQKAAGCFFCSADCERVMCGGGDAYAFDNEPIDAYWRRLDPQGRRAGTAKDDRRLWIEKNDAPCTSTVKLF